jgi:hypothetical protein
MEIQATHDMTVYFISNGKAQVELTHYDDDATCSVVCRSVINKLSQISDLFHRRRKDQGVYRAALGAYS